MTAETQQKIAQLKSLLQEYPDFPKKGILFYDIFSLLKNPTAFQTLTDLLIDHAKAISPKITSVVGLDSRGFLFGPLIALHLQVPFYPIRKRGKLPGDIERVEFTLEYGKDIVEIQTGNLTSIDRVLVVDDLLATGGTMAAACSLLKKCHVKDIHCLVVIELLALNGRDKIEAPVESLLKY